MQMEDKMSVKKSSGNIFSDLGFENPQEELLKANLTARICQILEEKNIKQKEIAEILGIDQPKVSAIMNGKYAGFSVERLLSFILALEKDIEIIIKPHISGNHRPPEIQVLSAI